MTGEAWRAFCRRLEAAGDRLLDDDFPGSPRDRAEGVRHLARLAVFGLQWALEFADPDFPAFHRYDDDIVKWGGPNVDNTYLRARIRGDAAYRIWGRAPHVSDFILSTHEGDMQLEQYGVFAERSLRDLVVARDGSFDVFLGGQERGPGWVPLDPAATHVLVRQYFDDWDEQEPAELHIEQVDRSADAPAALAPERVADGLEEAAEWIERSLVYWNDYLRRMRDAAPANQLSPPTTPPGGASDILYGGGFWELDEDQALVVECEVPEARSWSIQLYTLGWFESLDVLNRQGSLNGRQIHVDGDGRFRVVLSHADPRVPNWLDTEGRHEGSLSYRWVWSSTSPAPSTSVVALDEVREHLPDDHPSVTAAERRERIADRRVHLERRFRR